MKKINVIGRCKDNNPIAYLITKFEPLSGNYRVACCESCFKEFSKCDTIEVKKIGIRNV